MASDSALFPQVELRVQDQMVLTLPPRRLKRLQYTSTLAAGSFEFDLFDPEFEELELQLIHLCKLDQDGQQPPLEFRFGFAEENRWNPAKGWRRGLILGYLPELTPAGMELHLTGIVTAAVPHVRSQGASFATTLSPSEIVTQLALEDPAVEEVVAVPSRPLIEGAAGAGAWILSVAVPVHQTWEQFVRDQLLPVTMGQDGAYNFELMPTDNGKGYYFGPLNQQGDPVHTFRVLTNQHPSLKSFRPQYPAETLGSAVGQGMLAHSYNPNTKLYHQWIVDPIKQGKKERNAGWDQTARILEETGYKGSAQTLLKMPEEKRAAWIKAHTNWTVLLPMINAALGQVEIENSWEKLYHQVASATAEFIGDQETATMRAGELHQFQVVLPSGALHWSSGFYTAVEVTHTIADKYDISVKYNRAYDREGAL